MQIIQPLWGTYSNNWKDFLSICLEFLPVDVVHSLLPCHCEPSRKVCFHSLSVFTSDIDPLFFRLNRPSCPSLSSYAVCLSHGDSSHLCWTHTTPCRYILLRGTKLDKVGQIKNNHHQITLYTWCYFPNRLFPCKRSWHRCENSLKCIRRVINFVKINQSQNLNQKNMIVTQHYSLQWVCLLNVRTESSTLLSLLPFQDVHDEILKNTEENSKDYQQQLKVCFSSRNPWHLGLQ